MARMQAADFDERMTLVEHLDELRTRVVISVAALLISGAVCFWRNHDLIEIANEPLPADVGQLIVISPGESFVTTLTLAFYGAILISLPIILYQVYAYVLPAFTPSEKRVIFPLLLMVPFLFIGGVVFSYFVVVPAALDFLLNFNADEFDVLPRARDYYSFFALALLSVGLLFQLPVVILAITQLGIVTPAQLAENRRYAFLAIAVMAMLLPGTDPVTMLIAMGPLLLLYEFSIVIARIFGRARAAPEALAEDSGGGERDPGRPPGNAG